MAKEGYPFILGGLGVAALLLAGWYVLRAGGYCTSAWVVFSLGMVSLVFGLFSSYFFRDPERNIPTDTGAVVSPGDGKVVEIVREDDPFVGPNAHRVSIFLTVFNVHVNRVPISGTVAAVRYIPGKFLAAFNDKASHDNEQTHIAVTGERGTVSFKQIAGLIARRIVYTVSEGDSVTIGQRCGLIRFGSRVDVILPPEAEIRVRVGETARGGETIIGILP